MSPTRVAVAGSTGSIGTQTLEVIAAAGDDYVVDTLMAGSSLEPLVEQAKRVRPRLVVLGDESRWADLVAALGAAGCSSIDVAVGVDAMGEAAAEADVTVNAIVGFAGLAVTLASLRAGKRLALANKESLIAAGPVVQAARQTPGAELLPVDSEHAAIHMCLRGVSEPPGVARLVLTASGGPFRGRSAADLAGVTVDEALAHPTWSMGPKITVDSSTLMNKGLEVIEANELFGLPAGRQGFGLPLDAIDVVVHPQSIVHSMVTLTDGATIAQLSHPDMRLPIGYALAYPDRLGTAYGEIGWGVADIGGSGQSWSLTFEPPDRAAFPCLDLAYEAARVGQCAPAALNAANEVAVDAFLKGILRWADISRVNQQTLDAHDGPATPTLEDVLNIDRQARRSAAAIVAGRAL